MEQVQVLEPDSVRVGVRVLELDWILDSEQDSILDLELDSVQVQVEVLDSALDSAVAVKD